MKPAPPVISALRCGTALLMVRPMRIRPCEESVSDGRRPGRMNQSEPSADNGGVRTFVPRSASSPLLLVVTLDGGGYGRGRGVRPHRSEAVSRDRASACARTKLGRDAE